MYFLISIISGIASLIAISNNDIQWAAFFATSWWGAGILYQLQYMNRKNK